jgi:hypothetical protein
MLEADGDIYGDGVDRGQGGALVLQQPPRFRARFPSSLTAGTFPTQPAPSSRPRGLPRSGRTPPGKPSGMSVAEDQTGRAQ